MAATTTTAASTRDPADRPAWVDAIDNEKAAGGYRWNLVSGMADGSIEVATAYAIERSEAGTLFSARICRLRLAYSAFLRKADESVENRVMHLDPCESISDDFHGSCLTHPKCFGHFRDCRERKMKIAHTNLAPVHGNAVQPIWNGPIDKL